MDSLCDPSHIWGMCVHSSSASSSVHLYFYYCWTFEHECEATTAVSLLKLQRHTVHKTELQRSALCHCLWVAQFPNSLDWGYTQYMCCCFFKCQYDFVWLTESLYCWLWRIYSVLSPVLRNACLLSVQMPFWLPAFIYHAIPSSNIYLLHVVYHLIHSIALSVSFRIKQTET